MNDTIVLLVSLTVFCIVQSICCCGWPSSRYGVVWEGYMCELWSRTASTLIKSCTTFLIVVSIWFVNSPVSSIVFIALDLFIDSFIRHINGDQRPVQNSMLMLHVIPKAFFSNLVVTAHRGTYFVLQYSWEYSCLKNSILWRGSNTCCCFCYVNRRRSFVKYQALTISATISMMVLFWNWLCPSWDISDFVPILVLQ